MPAACLYFQAHQPNRLLPYDFFRIGEHQHYEDDGLNLRILNKVSERCYLPANRLFLNQRHGWMRSLISFGSGRTWLKHNRPANRSYPIRKTIR